ncbi:dual specificity protein phosphatase PHS1-like isoform X1 [Euphorbia lathyris]|uniref:dual specificity protein phosphatase PHS1-like isoform X1 n=1 Tax=Euphorbia lathyris TaxID=212925 RepID=UPI0033137EAE
MNISSKTSGDSDKEDIMVPDTALNGGLHCPSPPGKDRFLNDNHLDFSDSELPRTVPRSSSSGNKESSDSRSPMSKECWSGKLSKAGDIHLTTTKLRHIHKCAKVDTVSNKKLEQWNEMLRTDAIKLCQDNNFMTGFFEGTDTNYVVDAYELKIRLEHILERISLISDAADTEKPSPLTNYLSIGGCISRCGPLLNGFSLGDRPTLVGRPPDALGVRPTWLGARPATLGACPAPSDACTPWPPSARSAQLDAGTSRPPNARLALPGTYAQRPTRARTASGPRHCSGVESVPVAVRPTDAARTSRAVKRAFDYRRPRAGCRCVPAPCR